MVGPGLDEQSARRHRQFQRLSREVVALLKATIETAKAARTVRGLGAARAGSGGAFVCRDDLVPVAPEVFAVPDEQSDEQPDGSDDSFDHEGEDGPAEDVAPSSDASSPTGSGTPSEADAPHPADGGADQQ